MIITEDIGNNMILTYSDQGVYIHGGDPQGDYISAEDPIDTHRTYVETDIPIPAPEDEEEATAADYQDALAELGVK